MFKAQNVHLVPNILAHVLEEDGRSYKQERPLLRDATNTKIRACPFSKVSKCKGDEQSLAYAGEEESVGLAKRAGLQKQNQSSKGSKLKNLLISFDKEESSADQQKENSPKKEIKNVSNPPQSRQRISEKVIVSKKDMGSKKENCLLLIMDSSEDQDEPDQVQQPQKPPTQKQLVNNEPVEETETKQIQQPCQTKPADNKPPSKQQVLLDLQPQDQQQICEQQEQILSIPEKQPANKRMTIRLAGLFSRYGYQYYLSPIPYGAVFECAVKRDRCESMLKYHLYDCVSWRNFMTIIKDEEGYLIVSREVDKSKMGTNEERDWVVGRVVSNFFGTQFNCLLGQSPYTKGCKYPVNENGEKIITIEYQTNILGLKGPRKFSAYIPNLGQRTCQRLNEVYQKQAKKKLKPTVLKYKNKTPKWCKEINAYILNFHGRATVSSIKNFIMIGQGEEDTACESVLFGKYGRELFNLDLRYPFSILQGVALILSSFDRKLACE